jgi:hypothetical protein
MAAIVELTPLTDHGREPLDELERLADLLPFKTNERTGSRTYHLNSKRVSVDGLDPMLDSIDTDWRRHLRR